MGIEFPGEYGDLRLSSIQCSMDTNATCKISRSNAVEIASLRETGLLKHRIRLTGIKNPSTLSNTFVISSYLGQDIDNILCQAVETVVLLESTPSVCGMEVDATHQTQSATAIYSFNIQCDNVFRNESELLIKLPTPYIYTNSPEINCWASDRQNLLSPTCSLEYINGSHYLKASNILIDKNQNQL